MIDFSISQLALLTELNTAATEIVRHRPKLTFLEWAPKFVENPDGSKFAFRKTQEQIAEDIFNPALLSVSVRAFSGMGKTYLFSAAMCFAIEQLRTQIGVMFPNKSLAEGWVNDELQRMFDATPAIAQLRMERDIQRFKRWRTGSELSALGANSSGLMRRLQASVLYTDEIDAIEQTKTDEGDKVDQFFKRSRGRKEQFKWATSYPSLKGHSKIDARIQHSDGCRWYVECWECGHQYELHTKQNGVDAWTTRNIAAHLPEL